MSSSEGHEEARGPDIPSNSGGGDVDSLIAGFSGKSLWSWASKAREAVTKAADEVASSFTNTNWGQELADFKSGLFSEAAADARALREAVSSNQLQERSKAALAAAKEQSQKILKSMESNPFMNQLVDASTSFAKMATSFVEQSRRTVETIIDDAVRESTAQEGASGNAGGQTAALTAMQQDPRTYLEDPEDPGYPAFRASFAMTSRAEDIGTLLADNVVIRELNARIVPSLVAADDFWARYFFRADGLESSAPASGGERGRNADEESPGAPVQAGGGELGQREEGSVGGHAEEEAGSDFSVVPALREGEERDERVASPPAAAGPSGGVGGVEEGGGADNAGEGLQKDRREVEKAERSTEKEVESGEVKEGQGEDDDDWLDDDGAAGDEEAVDEEWANWE